jgi:hypothetical protein
MEPALDAAATTNALETGGERKSPRKICYSSWSGWRRITKLRENVQHRTRREGIVSRFVKILLAGIIASAIAGLVAFTPDSAQAAKLSKAEKIAVNQARVACKAEARGKKIGLLARRKFVNTCVARALKGYPTVNAAQLSREHPNMKRLRAIQPSEWGCPDMC